jgi:hypothetical protein
MDKSKGSQGNKLSLKNKKWFNTTTDTFAQSFLNANKNACRKFNGYDGDSTAE